ncbi:cytochrome P450 [Mycena latifolia]|nr:cytochrome P450 [Mycena latifolia]
MDTQLNLTTINPILGLGNAQPWFTAGLSLVTAYNVTQQLASSTRSASASSSARPAPPADAVDIIQGALKDAQKQIASIQMIPPPALNMLAQLLLSAFGTLVAFVLFHLVRFLYTEVTSPLRGMVGPNNPSLLLGHVKELEASTILRLYSRLNIDPISCCKHDSGLTEKWKAQYGLNFQMKGLFSTRELYTADTKALNHIAVHNTLYEKPPFVRYHLSQVVGTGLIVVEGDDHKRQNPAFGVPQIRELTSVFVDKSLELRNIWAGEIASTTSGAARIEALSWVSKMTLDVIGQAGFNYHFNALDPGAEPSELNKIFHQIFHAPPAPLRNALRLAKAVVPIMRPLPIPGDRLLRQAQEGMARIGAQLLAGTRAALAHGSDARRRDLLSLLVNANAREKTPLSDTELVAQLPAFFVAGHETTRFVISVSRAPINIYELRDHSTATAWALYALARNLGAQRKLREEVRALDTEHPTLDELNALPYLESVIRETLRAHSPVAYTARMAMVDDVLPLSRPYVDGNGQAHESLPIGKGQVIHIPILDVNTDTEIWGEDADVFRPERWEQIPDAANNVPGVYAHLFTFLAGPRNCIGFRFALAEMKALLFVLIRAFEFEMAVPEGGIGRTSAPVQRPVVLSEIAKGAQMPLIVRPYQEEA